ncbi:MAG: HEPN domain-containing protein [Fimbriimonas sp.]|nr:HEPN domain-containing protein [Fimbriimonas sp.]
MPSIDAQRWVEKAVEDEDVVALIRTNRGPWSIAAYHIQQAAEKYIKAVLVEAGIAPPKTHDLPQLISLVPNGTAMVRTASKAGSDRFLNSGTL